MQEKPDPELLDALKASLGQRYAGMKDAPWFKEAHEGKPSGEGTRVDSVEPPASTGCGHEFDRGRCIHCGTKRPLCEKCKSEAARTPRWMAAPECTHAASQEGPSEVDGDAEALKLAERIRSVVILRTDLSPREMVRHVADCLLGYRSSSRVAVRDEALTGVGRFMFHLHDETRHDPQMGNKELCCRCFPEYKPDCHCGMETACRALKGGKP